MSKAIIAAAASGLGSLLLVQPALADSQDQNVTEFKKVTVSATRIATDSEQVNRSVVVVDQEKMDELQASSVAEMINRQANVNVSGGAVPGNQKVNIRGLEGDKVLQVIDGARSNTNFAHRPSYFIEPELLKSVEVMKGPSSSLWGSGAIAGVVVQNTVDAEDLVQEGNTIGGFIKQSMTDNGDGRTTSGALATQKGNVDTLVALSFRHSDALDQGNGDKLYGTKTNNSSLLTKVGVDLDDNQRVELQFRHALQDGHPPTVGAAEDARNAENNLIQRKVKDQHFALDYTNEDTSSLLNFNGKLFVNNTDNEEINLAAGTDISDVRTIGLNLVNAFDFDKTQVLAGIDGYLDTIETQRTVDLTNPSGNRPNPPSKANSQAWGAFTTVSHDIIEGLQAEASLRLDSFETESKDLDSSADEKHLSKSAAIRWETTDWMRWTLRYDEAFRAPSAYELYIQGTHFNYGAPGWDNSFIANPNLKPEKAQNMELGLNLNFNNLVGKDALNIEAAVFQNDVEDFIYLDVETSAQFGFPGACNCITGTSTHKNARDAELWGYEVMADYKRGALNASLGYGQTRGKHRTSLTSGETDGHLPSIPADKWTADVNYGFWNIDTKLGARVLSSETQDRVETGTQTWDNYTLTDFYATWEPSSEALEGLKVDFVVANAFDENYQQAWSQVAEPGRTAKVAAKYSF